MAQRGNKREKNEERGWKKERIIRCMIILSNLNPRVLGPFISRNAQLRDHHRRGASLRGCGGVGDPRPEQPLGGLAGKFKDAGLSLLIAELSQSN
jgi:hypothetical protein